VAAITRLGSGRGRRGQQKLDEKENDLQDGGSSVVPRHRVERFA